MPSSASLPIQVSHLVYLLETCSYASTGGEAAVPPEEMLVQLFFKPLGFVANECLDDLCSAAQASQGLILNC